MARRVTLGGILVCCVAVALALAPCWRVFAGRGPALRLGRAVLNADGSVTVPLALRTGGRHDIAAVGFVLDYDAAGGAVERGGVTAGPVVAVRGARLDAKTSMPGEVRGLVLPAVRRPIGTLASGVVAEVRFVVRDARVRRKLARIEERVGKRTRQLRLKARVMRRWVRRSVRLRHVDAGSTRGKSIPLRGGVDRHAW